MGQYKVIQDIEAEDKLLGPLSFRQFIYLIIVVVQLFVAYLMISAPGPIKYFVIFLLPSLVFFAVLAAPFGHDQSNEIWLLAKVRFFFKPRRRIWDQTGMKELVTITVPKKIERQLTKDFSREEAQNRLKALANTLDTRGWAVKNVGVNMFNQPAYQGQMANVGMVNPTDRLVDVSTADPVASSESIATPFDQLDTGISQQFTEHIAKTKQARREQMSHMATIPTGKEEDVIDWFAPEVVEDAQMAPPPQTNSVNKSSFTQVPEQDENSPIKEDSKMKETSKPAIIEPANNNDLSVGTLERRAVREIDEDNDEVVISLR